MNDENTEIQVEFMQRHQKWLRWMHLGKRLGCHQRPERSFFIKGYQFPVCARCTGVLLSSAVSCILFWFCPLEWQYCIALSAIMFLDWLIQWLGVRESTNTRRIITGLLGGYGVMTIQLYIYCRLADWLWQIVKFFG